MIAYLWDRLEEPWLSLVRRYLPNLRVGVLTHLDRGPVPANGMPLMVDVGLRFALTSARVNPRAVGRRAAWELARVAAMSRTSEVMIVLPDSLGSWQRTVEMSRAAAEELPKATRHYHLDARVDVAIVAHEVWLGYHTQQRDIPEQVYKAVEELGGSVVIALPTHIMDLDGRSRIRCAQQPRTCLRELETWVGEGVYHSLHLLGPPLALSDALRILPTIRSIDSSSYRRAPTNTLKRLNRGYVDPRDPITAQAWAAYWLLRFFGVDKTRAELAVYLTLRELRSGASSGGRRGA